MSLDNFAKLHVFHHYIVKKCESPTLLFLLPVRYRIHSTVTKGDLLNWNEISTGVRVKASLKFHSWFFWSAVKSAYFPLSGKLMFKILREVSGNCYMNEWIA